MNKKITKERIIKCEALTHFPGKAGGNYEYCSWRAKFKITPKFGKILYLCGVHIKRRGYNLNEKIEEL